MDKQIFEPMSGYEDVTIKFCSINMPAYLNFNFTVLQGSLGTNVLKMVCKCNEMGGMSLTNGMHHALEFLIPEFAFPIHKIIYRDSDLTWCEVLWDGQTGEFRPFSRFSMYDETMALREVVKQ